MRNSAGTRRHTDRRRAESFGSDALRYERARPSYPEALGDDLVTESTRSVLDVGCGTGKASRLFRERGCDVLGVEVDVRMAEVARASGLEVEIGRFEAWEPAGRLFDLVASGQAWHWVDPVEGPAKAAGALRPGGRIALFWNYRRSLGAQADVALAECYARFAKELTYGPLLAHFDRDAETERHITSLEASRLYSPPITKRYTWEQRYGREDWLDLAATQSDHMALGPEALAALLEKVAETIDSLGGSLLVQYETVCVLAPRK